MREILNTSGKLLCRSRKRSVRAAVEEAVSLGISLKEANLQGARLTGAELANADLQDACLVGANLLGACLAGANMHRTDLRWACLYDAGLMDVNLKGADFFGAILGSTKLYDAKLACVRNMLILGPMGSREDFLYAVRGPKGVKVQAGCCFKSIRDFLKEVDEKHGDNEHARNYRAAAEMIKAWAENTGGQPQE